MFLTKGHGPIAHNGGWYTTNPEALREECQRRGTNDAQRVVTLVRRRGDKIVRLPATTPSPLKLAS